MLFTQTFECLFHRIKFMYIYLYSIKQQINQHEEKFKKYKLKSLLTFNVAFKINNIPSTVILESITRIQMNSKIPVMRTKTYICDKKDKTNIT